MRLKTKLVLAITALVFLIAGVLSLVYVSQLLHAAVQQSYQNNRMVADQVRLALLEALETGLRDRQVDPNNPAELRSLTAAAVRDNKALEAVLDSVDRYSLTVYDINIGDIQNLTLLSTNPENEDKPLPARPNYEQLLSASFPELVRTVLGKPAVFDVVLPLTRNGAPFASVHVGVRTTFLRAVYAPWLHQALTLMGISLVVAIVVAFLLANLALRPLEAISRQLDRYTANQAGAGKAPRQDTAAQVSNKIEIIGQRMKNVEEVFSALKENLDQILGNLQDGVLLFTADGRAVLVSEAARRFLNLESGRILGRPAAEIFEETTVLGRTLREAFAARHGMAQREIRTETGRRIQASVDFIHDSGRSHDLGALVTLHDLESVAAIGSELELSRRMAAIGRLTAGVGHEVKNPINAIVVHLELLKNKLGEDSAPAARHLEIIESEIHRLDRVVQTLADFSRPVELNLREQDLGRVVGEVLALARDEMILGNVELVTQMTEYPLPVFVDGDLIKQAVLNVLKNGAQAMPEGGRLTVTLEEENTLVREGNGAARGAGALLRIGDEGPGIPESMHEKIFDLYFTTKTGGSGIGLAMTYRILQLHHGSVEVQSKEGGGAEFQFRIPLLPFEALRLRDEVAGRSFTES
jgi:signal transduction histidine kinase